MEEKRRTKRTSLQSKLIMKRLGETQIDGQEEISIEILDVSKNGIGFRCKEALEIGTVYESYLTIWTKEVLHAFLQIVRIELLEKEFIYGASFIGMSEMDANRIEVYQSFNDNE